MRDKILIGWFLVIKINVMNKNSGCLKINQDSTKKMTNKSDL